MAKKFHPRRASKAIGLKIREIRTAKGWTLEYCEERGYKSWRHLQSIEAGKNMTVQTLINVANLLGVHPAELLRDV
jgi:transcriptional regulator with XRE-family HTH domain